MHNPPLDNPRFLGIDHLGIAVTDLEEASTTYRDLLGFELLGEETLADRGLQVRFFATGNARIELLGATSDDSEISGFLAKRGEGIHHVCVRVANLANTVESMQAAGAQIVGDGIQTGAHNTRVAFVHPKSAHGVLLELVEQADGGGASP